ncbi:MAG: SPOR domain-containing protein [Bacteroidales bacterium]|nr:SPOR domain-containing protein [Bacteroidales bacterium]
MDLAKHINTLLFTTDRVVVPGLGVFSTKYIPAKIHTAKQTFEPPSKELLFTSAIKDDNGILIRHISEMEGIKEEIAKEELEKYVKQYNTQLSEGKKLKFIKLGTLSKKPDGTYLFEADRTINYLNDAFGMEEISVPETIKTEVKKKEPHQRKITKPAKKKKTKKQPWIIYVLISLAAIIILGVFNFDLISSKWDEVFRSSKTITEIPDQSTETKITGNEELVIDTLPAKDSIIVHDDVEDTLETKIIEDAENKKEIPEQENPEVVSKRFYIVAGSFKSVKNAEKMLKKLISKGYNSEIFGTTTKGLQMVSYESYKKRKDAGIALKKILREENASAWIIKY